MKSIFAAVALATLTVPLAACGGDGDDALAERADAIDDADVNAHAMTNAQKADVIENGVAPTN